MARPDNGPMFEFEHLTSTLLSLFKDYVKAILAIGSLFTVALYALDVVFGISLPGEVGAALAVLVLLTYISIVEGIQRRRETRAANQQLERQGPVVHRNRQTSKF